MRRGRRAHEVDELVVDDLDDHLAGVDAGQHLDAERLLLDAFDEVARDREVDVGLEERQPHLAERLLDVVLGDPALAGELAEEALEALGERVEHRENGYVTTGVRRRSARGHAQTGTAGPFVHAVRPDRLPSVFRRFNLSLGVPHDRRCLRAHPGLRPRPPRSTFGASRRRRAPSLDSLFQIKDAVLAPQVAEERGREGPRSVLRDGAAAQRRHRALDARPVSPRPPAAEGGGRIRRGDRSS